MEQILEIGQDWGEVLDEFIIAAPAVPVPAKKRSLIPVMLLIFLLLLGSVFLFLALMKERQSKRETGKS